MSLMSFILDTLQPRVNDSANSRMWLPAQLAGMTDSDNNPVLPISATNQQLGAITGSAGQQVASDFASTYATFVGASEPYTVGAEPDPSAPLPTFAFPQLQILGLENLEAEAHPPVPNAGGYDVTLELAFGAYSGTVNGIVMHPLSLTGQYDINQALLYGNAANPPSSWTSTLLHGTGQITIVLTACKMLASAAASISGTGDTRTVQVTVNSLQLVGVDASGKADPSVEPVVNVTNLTLDADLGGAEQGLIAIIENALQQPEASAALTQEVNALLGASDNLGSINQLLAARTDGVLDAILGPVAAGGLPDDTGQKAATAVDLYLFDRIRLALNDEGSSWFLPLQLASSVDPVIDPYVNSEIDVPDQTIMGLKYSGIVLTDVVLAGASNTAMPVPATMLNMGPITTTLTLGKLAGGPVRTVQRGTKTVQMAVPPVPPINFGANFTITQNGITQLTLTGALAVGIAGATAILTITPAGTSVDDLTITLSQATASLAASTTTVSVSLNPPNDNSGLQQLIQMLFSKPQVQNQILSVLNETLAKQAGDLSDQLSQIARNAIISNLGG